MSLSLIRKITSFTRAIVEIFNFYFGCVTYGPPCIYLYQYIKQRQQKNLNIHFKVKIHLREQNIYIDITICYIYWIVNQFYSSELPLSIFFKIRFYSKLNIHFTEIYLTETFFLFRLFQMN